MLRGLRPPAAGDAPGVQSETQRITPAVAFGFTPTNPAASLSLNASMTTVVVRSQSSLYCNSRRVCQRSLLDAAP